MKKPMAKKALAAATAAAMAMSAVACGAANQSAAPAEPAADNTATETTDTASTETEAEPEAEDEAEYDEHIWLSVRIAEDVCQKLRDSLSSLDEANKAIYSENCEIYKMSENSGIIATHHGSPANSCVDFDKYK